MRTKVLLLGFFLIPASSWARDREFDSMVRQIETQYQTKPMHIPFLGVARFLVSAVRPYGARNFQLAVFENLGPEAGKPIDFEPPGPEWQVVTRVTSLKHPENTLIYARPSGANIKMLIVTTETNEATVVEVEVDPERFARQIQSSIEKHGSEKHSSANRSDE